MQTLQDIIIAFIMGYIGLTNQLAYFIQSHFNPEEAGTENKIALQAETDRISLIPDVLLRSLEYQQASLIESNTPTYGSYTHNPEEALVNIFCTLTTNDTIRTTTGTGFFIDERGVILTNAHVAQFLLLKNTDRFKSINCVVRTGSPAVARYSAELLYISPAWVQKHAVDISNATPLGTGERDYALLYIANSLTGEELPSVFPALKTKTELLPISIKDTEVLAAGYPATSLFTDGRAGLFTPAAALTTVSELYTFGSNYADVVSLRGSRVGEHGTSGGPVLNQDGEAFAMIATRGNDQTDGDGSLRAITLSHIDRTITEESGVNLRANLAGNITYRAGIFNELMTPFLRELLELNLQ